jgi:hypothetical protein
MDTPRVTGTVPCRFVCGRDAPVGTGVVGEGCCDGCFHEGAVAFWAMLGIPDVVQPRKILTHAEISDFKRDHGFEDFAP